MPAFVDHPRPGVPFDPAEFWINGWLWLEQRHDQLAAIEAWHDDTFLGAVDSAALIERPDVSARYDIPAGVRTGFAFAARYANAPTRPFGLALRGRLRDGSLTEPVVTSEVTPDSLQELLRIAGFIGGRRSRFELVMQAERYPPDRIDGIALVLRKRERERRSGASRTMTGMLRLAFATTGAPDVSHSSKTARQCE